MAWLGEVLTDCESHHGTDIFLIRRVGPLGVVAGRSYQLCYADLKILTECYGCSCYTPTGPSAAMQEQYRPEEIETNGQLHGQEKQTVQGPEDASTEK